MLRSADFFFYYRHTACPLLTLQIMHSHRKSDEKTASSVSLNATGSDEKINTAGKAYARETKLAAFIAPRTNIEIL